jgi:hypothetical protein
MAGYNLKTGSPTKDAKMKGSPSTGKKGSSKIKGAKVRAGKYC